MGTKLHLPKTYIHTGVFLGPGETDVKAVMKKHGHAEDIQQRAEDDLKQRIEEHKQAAADGTLTPMAPITAETKIDGSITAVTQGSEGTDPDTTQKAPAAAAIAPTAVAKTAAK